MNFSGNIYVSVSEDYAHVREFELNLYIIMRCLMILMRMYLIVCEIYEYVHDFS